MKLYTAIKVKEVICWIEVIDEKWASDVNARVSTHVLKEGEIERPVSTFLMFHKSSFKTAPL